MLSPGYVSAMRRREALRDCAQGSQLDEPTGPVKRPVKETSETVRGVEPPRHVSEAPSYRIDARFSAAGTVPTAGMARRLRRGRELLVHLPRDRGHPVRVRGHLVRGHQDRRVCRVRQVGTAAERHLPPLGLQSRSMRDHP